MNHEIYLFHFFKGGGSEANEHIKLAMAVSRVCLWLGIVFELSLCLPSERARFGFGRLRKDGASSFGVYPVRV
jgi:hypothetical protein